MRNSRRAIKAIGRTYKNHIDGFNLLPYLTGETKESPRNFYFYFSDDGDVLAMRFDNWKIVFMEQRVQGTLEVWSEPFVRLRVPKVFNLRTDPYEFADVTSNSYYDWFIYHAYFIYGGADRRREVRCDVQGVSGNSAAEQLHHRRRDGENERERGSGVKADAKMPCGLRFTARPFLEGRSFRCEAQSLVRC